VVGRAGKVCASALLPPPTTVEDPCREGGSGVAPDVARVGWDGTLALFAAQKFVRGVDYACRFTVWPRAVR